LTGGLHNPFALLLLGPVTISAAVLTTRSTLLLGGTAIVVVTLLSEYHLPLTTQQGFILRIPDLFVFGNWIALVIAICFISAYSRRVTSEIHSMSDALSATQLALSREQKLTDLGGVVAAAAHELGTPLATIKLASAELMEELEGQPELYADAALIRQQADRCRDILRDMGRAGKDDVHLRQAPLMIVVQEAAEPHVNRGKTVEYVHDPAAGNAADQPSILRKPEIIHGLRNLVQNAVDFSRSSVWIEAHWSQDTVTLRIMDDGLGFPPQLLGRIGDPFVRRRKTAIDRSQRPEYEGMGLGLFIAKTLLERSGAELTFANGSDPYAIGDIDANHVGAIVEVVWPRGKIDARIGENAVPQGQRNEHIRA
jgi:two-component system sensor histidine kinase RegB